MASFADQIIAEGDVEKVEAMQAEIARLTAVVTVIRNLLDIDDTVRVEDAVNHLIAEVAEHRDLGLAYHRQALEMKKDNDRLTTETEHLISRGHDIGEMLDDKIADNAKLRASLEWVEQNSNEPDIAGYAGRAAALANEE